jgi:hypothetical protein
MNMKKLRMLAVGIAFLGVGLPAFAHHSVAAEYDRSKPVSLPGKLTRVELLNPHGFLSIETHNSQGNVETWTIELPGPGTLRRNGFDPNLYQTLMNSGEAVTVSAYPAKDGSKHALGGSLTRADGQTVISLGGRFAQGDGGNGRI